MLSNTCYKLPLELSKIMTGENASVTSIGVSISKNIELIIMTRFGEYRSDPTFGCEIWDLDFELIVNQGYWERQMCKSIQRSIAQHESRLSDIEVTVVLGDIEKTNAIGKHSEIRKKVEIKLKAVLKKTGESFNFIGSLFLSPLSLD